MSNHFNARTTNPKNRLDDEINHEKLEDEILNLETNNFYLNKKGR